MMTDASGSGRLTKRERMGFIGIPFVVSLLFVLGFRFISSRSFISYSIYGFISSLTNTSMVFLYIFLNKKYRKQEIQFYNSYIIAIFVHLTLIVPFLIYFILVSIIISGFRFPFNY
jgi:O-antigen/teichoic acid export membrane protein